MLAGLILGIVTVIWIERRKEIRNKQLDARADLACRAIEVVWGDRIEADAPRFRRKWRDRKVEEVK